MGRVKHPVRGEFDKTTSFTYILSWSNWTRCPSCVSPPFETSLR
jgi:hypothetical protein